MDVGTAMGRNFLGHDCLLRCECAVLIIHYNKGTTQLIDKIKVLSVMAETEMARSATSFSLENQSLIG